MTAIGRILVVAALLGLAPATAAAQQAPLLFTQPAGAGSHGIARADPATLRPTGPVAPLPAAGYQLDRSPDGRRAAVVTLFEDPGGQDEGQGLSEVDLTTGQTRWSQPLADAESPFGLAYLRPDRLVLVGATSNDLAAPRLVLVDPEQGQVLRRVTLPGGTFRGAVQIGDRLAVASLTASPDGEVDERAVNTVRIVDADGTVTASIVVPPVRGVGDSFHVDLAADPATGQVLAVTGGRAPRVHVIDPATGARTTRRLPRAGRPGAVYWYGLRTLVTDRPFKTGLLRRLDARGRVVARRSLPKGAVVSEDGSVVVARGRVTALAASGRQRWRTPVRAARAAATVGGLVVVTRGERRPRTLALDARTGKRVALPAPAPGTRLAVGDSDGGIGPQPLFVARFASP